MTCSTSQTKIQKKEKTIKFSNFIPFHFISFHQLPNNPKTNLRRKRRIFNFLTQHFLNNQTSQYQQEKIKFQNFISSPFPGDQTNPIKTRTNFLFSLYSLSNQTQRHQPKQFLKKKKNLIKIMYLSS